MGGKGSGRKPRQAYSAEERAEKQEALAAALAVTATAEQPEGNVKVAAEVCGLPRTTAIRWLNMDDEQFKNERKQWKRSFHGAGLDVIRRMTDAMHEALDDPERRKKTGVRDWAVAIGTMYDKVALAADEQASNPMALLAAGVNIGRIVERHSGQQQQQLQSDNDVIDVTPGGIG